MSFTYAEDHSIIEREYLDQLSKVKEELEAGDLDPQQLDAEFMRIRGYARARVPEEYWHPDTPFAISRTVVPILTKYVRNSQRAARHGLGLTICSPQPVCKLQPVYLMAVRLVDNGFSCFIATYNELIFWLKESWRDRLLRQELDARFSVSFFFLVEIPDNDELTPSLRQDLLARLDLRNSRHLPSVFTVNTPLQSMNGVYPNTFLGRLLLPFAAVNRPLIVEDLGQVDQLYEQRWEVLNDQG